MKAIRVQQFGGPEVLKIEAIPDLQPGPGQVAVKVHAAGVNPFETYQRTGTYAVKPQLPYTPGADAAGIVIGIGPGVQRVRTGDRVYVAGNITGSYAEQLVCLESQAHPLSKNVSFQQGAGMGVPYGTAYRALFQKAYGLPN
jgi:NADPH2:quinone reductase